MPGKFSTDGERCSKVTNAWWIASGLLIIRDTFIALRQYLLIQSGKVGDFLMVSLRGNLGNVNHKAANHNHRDSVTHNITSTQKGYLNRLCAWYIPHVLYALPALLLLGCYGIKNLP